ncbi:MAG: nuclear transport factor 2 family protein [Solirubrobacterales bacterium]
MSERNRETIRRFYAAFDAGDAEAMAACYAPGAHFWDPVFKELTGEEAGDMWRMLTGRSEDLTVELASHDADETTGTANWIARYTFSTGRKVVNDIDAWFEFDDAGLIIEHRDSFDFWKWTRMALGPIGVALGWSPIVQGKVRSEAAEGLAEFRAERP